MEQNETRVFVDGVSGHYTHTLICQLTQATHVHLRNYMMRHKARTRWTCLTFGKGPSARVTCFRVFGHLSHRLRFFHLVEISPNVFHTTPLQSVIRSCLL